MSDLTDRTFWIANDREIKGGLTTDYYFLNVEKALKSEGRDPRVVMEVYTRHLPYQENWGILGGINEALKLLYGKPVDVWTMDEGEVFISSRNNLAYEPVMRIEGGYADFARYETPILGFLCSLSGITTKAARLRSLAGANKRLLSFGTRRAHPALSAAIERCAYIGGFDGFSNIIGSRLLHVEATGTIPHSFILLYDDPRDAWTAFDKCMPKGSPRTMLVDTYYDEKTESIMALDLLKGKLKAIRLDTPGSRRGDWRKIIEEVRWELDIRGGTGVNILVSGGLDEEDILKLNDVVDGYGVGTAVSCAPPLDFNMKIVEVESQKTGALVKRAKRGDISGKKAVYRNFKEYKDIIMLDKGKPPDGYQSLLKPRIKGGKQLGEVEPLGIIRERVASRIKWLKDHEVSVQLVST